MFQGYSLREIKKAAESMDYPYRLALWKRKRYLEDVLAGEWEEYWWEETTCPVLAHYILERIRFCKSEIAKIDKELSALEARKDEITDDMIQRARSTPIETIIEFKRRLTHCIIPDHADKNPSMYHGTKTNSAICPACGAKYDSIGAYQIMYGCDFKTAVKRLQ